MKKKVDTIHVRSFKTELEKIIKKHGKAVIVFAGDGDLRRRLITEDGTCDVSYRYYGNHRWSHYEDSCFMSYTEDQSCWDDDYWGSSRRTIKKGKKKTLKNTLNALVKHDKNNEIIPLEITYGKGDKKKSLLIRGNY